MALKTSIVQWTRSCIFLSTNKWILPNTLFRGLTSTLPSKSFTTSRLRSPQIVVDRDVLSSIGRNISACVDELLEYSWTK